MITRSGRKLEVKEYGDAAGHPVFFFHGMIGSHYQASYIADQAEQEGCGSSPPTGPAWERRSSSNARARWKRSTTSRISRRPSGLDDFSVIGISGGTPYALATLLRLGPRVRTVTVISGMGPDAAAGCARRDGPPPAHWSSQSAPGIRNWRGGASESAGSFPSRPGSILGPLDRDMVGLATNSYSSGRKSMTCS